ncbi:MAG: carboxypeptidase regulatory-like domain-containing protein, partial [Acidobacteria bacterium]|nr:carboxypeptidase regulatory-like domain-containing protein [Acidobacteriota bacterium]
MKYEISGRVQEDGGRGIAGVTVSAFDKDLLFDDLLGEVLTDTDGAFHIEYNETRLKDLFAAAPDIYLKVRTASGQTLYQTDDALRFGSSPHERFTIEISSEALRAAGLEPPAPRGEITTEQLTTLTCLENVGEEDDLVKQIRNDMVGKASVLEMMRDYMRDLEHSLNNDALPFRKMAKLFELGQTFESLNGHYYGVAPGLRTGDLHGVAAEYGNLMGVIWGSAVVGVCPWSGKSYTEMTPEDRAQIVGSSVPEEIKVYRGINHFNRIEHAPVNIALTSLLTFMWHLKHAPQVDQLKYGYELNGGHFAAHRAPSVYHGTPREVFRLNYRHHELGNNPPLNYLVDEMVRIADGLYLGQVLFTTDHLFERYDPQADPARYHYQHFGYFLLFEESWNVEARRLFPFLEVPDAAVTTNIVGDGASALASNANASQQSKFTTLTLADPPDGDVNPQLLDEVRSDIQSSGDIMRTLKAYSDTLFKEHRTESHTFDKLHALFNAGIGPQTMHGFYRGALVSWESQKLLAAFGQNTINIVWPVSRDFSPWTGKSFRQIDEAELLKWTDGGEAMGSDPAFHCSNTVAFRTVKEKFTRGAMKVAGVVTEPASPEEHRLYGFDAHTFFFIGRPNRPSMLPENKGKKIYQFNYRWKPLQNIPPDCFCIDEITQIADGLYLGLLIYATDWLKPWNPATDIAAYKYRLFGYFLLMDEQWHALR